MPLPFSDCRKRLTIFLSKLGSISGRNSTTLTFVPKEEKMEANSMPTTPPPITQRLAGMWSIASISVEVSTPSQSIPGMGRRLGTDPVATMILSARYSLTVFSPFSPTFRATDTVLSLPLTKEALPMTMFTPRRLSLRPLRSVSTTAFFLSMILEKSMFEESCPKPAAEGFPAFSISAISAL